MPPSATYTESQPESKTESQSSSGPHITQWLPQLVLAALVSLAVAAIIGVSLSAVGFSSPEELRRPGQGIAQSFVMFASMQSLFYIPLHMAACHKGESLYLDPPIPSFCHQLHAWANLIIHITVTLWASACVPVAVGIYRGGGGTPTVHLKTDIFACATGLLFSAIILTVTHLAHRPFTLPWLSPPTFTNDPPPPSTTGTTEVLIKFHPKPGSTTTTTATSTSTDSPSPSPSSSPASSPTRIPLLPVNGSGGGGTTSRSTSSTRTRARTMTRTRRYVLEAPTPVPLSPPRTTGTRSSGELTDDSVGVGCSSRGGSSSSPCSRGKDGEASTPASVSVSEGDLVAGSVGGGSSSGGGVAAERKGVARAGTPTPGVGIGVGHGKQRQQQRAAGKGAAVAVDRRKRMGVGPAVFSFRRGRVAQRPAAGDGEQPGMAPTVPPPSSPPPSPPLPTYYVPGAWIPRRQSGDGVVMDV